MQSISRSSIARAATVVARHVTAESFRQSFRRAYKDGVVKVVMPPTPARLPVFLAYVYHMLIVNYRFDAGVVESLNEVVALHDSPFARWFERHVVAGTMRQAMMRALEASDPARFRDVSAKHYAIFMELFDLAVRRRAARTGGRQNVTFTMTRKMDLCIYVLSSRNFHSIHATNPRALDEALRRSGLFRDKVDAACAVLDVCMTLCDHEYERDREATHSISPAI